MTSPYIGHSQHLYITFSHCSLATLVSSSDMELRRFVTVRIQAHKIEHNLTSVTGNVFTALCVMLQQFTLVGQARMKQCPFQT